MSGRPSTTNPNNTNHRAGIAGIVVGVVLAFVAGIVGAAPATAVSPATSATVQAVQVAPDLGGTVQTTPSCSAWAYVTTSWGKGRACRTSSGLKLDVQDVLTDGYVVNAQVYSGGAWRTVCTSSGALVTCTWAGPYSDARMTRGSNFARLPY